MTQFRVIVIGAGSTGAAIAHDLALRGLSVILLERFGPAGGTTGHNQAQLHSGARYAVVDPESAEECFQENLILRKIMPGMLELNDGLFIALNEQHLSYRQIFLEGCMNCGIPAEEILPEQALRLEPRLNQELLAAIRIPDGVFDPYRFTLSFIASARVNGAQFRPFTEVISLDPQKGQVNVLQRPTGKEDVLGCDVIVNAAGPWASQVAAMAGVELLLEPSAGVMVTVGERLCNMVINLLDYPADGDIIVPQRNTCILGTTSWTVDDPDEIHIPEGHVESLIKKAAWMIPGADSSPVNGVMAAARPLIKDSAGAGRAASRGFRCYNHDTQGAPGLFSIIGGKTTTARNMAEKISDMVCLTLGVDNPCRTRSEILASYRLGL
jgi:glycerol-3-phosphate dehydrogenase